jgi:hypothetical protein
MITKLPKLYTDIPLHVLLKFGFHPLPEGVSMRPRSSLQKLTLQNVNALVGYYKDLSYMLNQ